MRDEQETSSHDDSELTPPPYEQVCPPPSYAEVQLSILNAKLVFACLLADLWVLSAVVQWLKPAMTCLGQLELVLSTECITLCML